MAPTLSTPLLKKAFQYEWSTILLPAIDRTYRILKAGTIGSKATSQTLRCADGPLKESTVYFITRRSPAFLDR